MLESDVRATMLYLSANPIVQYFLSILTGKALPNQQPLIKSNAATQFFSSIAYLTFGVIGSFVIINYFPIYLTFLLSVTWLFTVAGARKFQTEIHHQISHCRFSGNDKVDRFVSDLFTTVLLVQDYMSYKKEHQSHHGTYLATANDPDAKFLFLLGFKPGMTTAELWKQLWTVLTSPKFYLMFLWSRIKANFINAPYYRIVLSVIWLAVLASIVFAIGLINFVLVWGIPIVLIYQAGALLQFLTEHAWWKVKGNDETGKVHLAKLTTGRFFGEAYPINKDISAKVIWVIRMVFVHGVTRLFVCQGTLPVHDAHHRMAGTKEWANLIFVRQNDIDSGCNGWENYSERWGLFNMINGTFEHLSSLPPINEDKQANSASIKDVVLGM